MIAQVKKMIAGVALTFAAVVANAATIQLSADPFTLDYNGGELIEFSVDADLLEDGIGTQLIDVTVAQDLTNTIWNFDFIDDEYPLVVSLFDAAGSEVFNSGSQENSPYTFNLTNLAAGQYTMQLSSLSDDVNGNISAVPVPAAALLFGTALLGFAGFSARRKV